MNTLADILVNVVVLILNGTLTKKKAELAVKFAYKLVEVSSKTTEEQSPRRRSVVVRHTAERTNLQYSISQERCSCLQTAKVETELFF